MSNTVVVNSTDFIVPDPHEKSWGQNVTDLLIALAVANSGYANIVSVTTTPVTMTSGRTYLVNTSVARTLVLPTPALNSFVHIKDASGSAYTNNITIQRAASESIDGVASSFTFKTNWGSMVLVSDGTNWFVLASSQIKDDMINTGSGKGWVGMSTDGHLVRIAVGPSPDFSITTEALT